MRTFDVLCEGEKRVVMAKSPRAAVNKCFPANQGFHWESAADSLGPGIRIATVDDGYEKVLMLLQEHG